MILNHYWVKVDRTGNESRTWVHNLFIYDFIDLEACINTLQFFRGKKNQSKAMKNHFKILIIFVIVFVLIKYTNIKINFKK